MPAADPECHVLLVEDDEDTRDVLGEMLSEAGYRVRTAGSGAEATRILSTLHDPPRVALVDVVMPEVSGLEWIEAARHTHALEGTRVVVISGIPRSSVPAEPPGIAEWMLKPPPMDRLLALVERLTHE